MKTELQIEIIDTLKKRFESNMQRHQNIEFSKVIAKIEANPDKLNSLYQMEISGGEPDIVDYNPHSDQYIFFDCSEESPKGRRSLCYDSEALEKRKENKPSGSAIALAEKMGVEILDEAQYRYLQQLGKFDCKTSSWILTPEPIRKLGGALFCDRRYDNVFVYHNGAESYYAARGFRACLKI